jgi:hypothetical protein
MTVTGLEALEALAQYIVVADALQAMLQPLRAGVGEAALDTTVQNAALTFAALAERVATALAAPDQPWQAVRVGEGPSGEARGGQLHRAGARQHDASPDDATPPIPEGEPECVDLRVHYLDDGIGVDAVTLTRPATHAPVSLPWPTVELQRSAGGVVDFVADAEQEGTVVYRPTREVQLAVDDPMTLRLSWPDLHVARWQSALSRMRVTRNAQMLATPTVTSPALRPTAAAFVLDGAEVSTPQAVIPLLAWPNAPMPIAGPTLEIALARALETIFPASEVGTDIQLDGDIVYEHGVGALAATGVGDDPLRIALVASAFHCVPLGEVPHAVALAADAWMEANGPPALQGQWCVDLRFMARQAERVRALLEVSLEYALGRTAATATAPSP